MQHAFLRRDFQFRIIRSAVNDDEIAQWQDLSRRSCHQNPFLYPEFALPAWKYLTPEAKPVLLVVQSADDGRWLAAGSFCLGQTTAHLPVPHAVAYTSSHTYRTGLLLDAASAAEALDFLLVELTKLGWMCQGIEFPNLRLDSILAQHLIGSSGRCGFSWHTFGERTAPAVFPELVSDEYLAQRWSKNRRKALRRCRTRLQQLGPVTLRLYQAPDDVRNALETFLQLEFDSWKGAGGTAFLSDPRQLAFIREVVGGLAARGQVLVAELLAGDCVAASSINLLAGTSLFAFKIGWNSDLASTSPGVLHEAELLLESRARLRDFTIFDSCAGENSYISTIWPERIPIGTGMICMSRISQLGHNLVSLGRAAAEWLAQE